jgi:hypothetical protein
MTQLLYDPKPDYQLDGTPLGGVSCTCVAGEMCSDRNTHGRHLLDWHDIREATHDHEGGTNWGQVDDAIASLLGEDDLSTGWWTWEHIDHLIAHEGKGFGAAIRYTEIHRYGLAQIKRGVTQQGLVTGQERGFTGPDSWHAVLFHCWLQPGETRVVRGKTLAAPPDERGLVSFDPLCNGRRPTVAEGPVVYPESLVKRIVADSLMANGKLYGSVTLDARYEVDEEPPAHDPDPGHDHPSPHHSRVTLKFGAEHVHKHWSRTSPRSCARARGARRRTRPATACAGSAAASTSRRTSAPSTARASPAAAPGTATAPATCGSTRADWSGVA